MIKRLFHTLITCVLIGLIFTSCIEKTYYYIYGTTDETSGSDENVIENDNDEANIEPENDNDETNIELDNDTTSDYFYSAAYFAQQQPLRTSIADRAANEGNVISVAAAIGGKLEVDINDWAKFIINEELLTNTELYPNGTGLVLMPTHYYNLSNDDTMVVSSASISVADVDINFTDDFYADPLATDAYYAIPFELTDTSCDAILESKEYSIVAVKYQSKYHGTYYVQGYTAEQYGSNIVSYNNSDLSQNLTATTTTVAKNAIERTGQTLSIGTAQIENGNVKITVPDNGETLYDEGGVAYVEVEVTAAEGDSTLLTGTGSGKMYYDEDTHDCIFEISYIATSGGIYYAVAETLTRRQDPVHDLIVEFWSAPDEI